MGNKSLQALMMSREVALAFCKQLAPSSEGAQLDGIRESSLKAVTVINNIQESGVVVNP